MPAQLFTLPPAIVASDYLLPTEAAKLAGIRLTSPPSAWSDEVLQQLLRDNPYIPIDRVVVNFSRRDDTQGYATGSITIIDAPGVSIPVIIQAGVLQPLDLLVLSGSAEDSNTGVGNTTDDKVMPLTERTFTEAIDSSPIGTVVRPNETSNTGLSEDGSQLRLPMRGRTVLASVLGAAEPQKKAMKDLLASSGSIVAGFYLHDTVKTAEAWLNAPAPACTLIQKIANQGVELPAAKVVTDFPATVKTAEFVAAEVFVSSGQAKLAAAFDAISLHAPEKGAARWLAFADGTYCPAPAEVLATKTAEVNPDAVLDALTTVSLRRGTTVSFLVDDIFTAPAKIAAIATDEGSKSVLVRLTDELSRVTEVTFMPGVKVASRVDTASWIFPATAKVLQLGTYSNALLTPAEATRTLEKAASAVIGCSNGQYSLRVPGTSLQLVQGTKEAAARILTLWFSNGADLLKAAEEHGTVRFSADVHAVEAKVAALTAHGDAARKEAAALVAELALPLENALKLAAAIGRADGADAVLATGFLSEDNLAEFTGMAGEFADTVNNLARLLLAIRMGYPGDENATAVAMKALQRVADRLASVQQDLMSNSGG